MMDPNELFKRFFETPFPGFGFSEFRSNRERDGWSREDHRMTDMFENFHQYMEELDEKMQDLYRTIGPIEVDPSVPIMSADPHNSEPHSKSSPRDQMLKDGKTGPSSLPEQHSSPELSEQPTRPIFPRSAIPFFEIPHWNRIPLEERKDTDLDNQKPDSQQIVDLFEKKQKPGPFSFSSSSVSIQTVIGADGKVEERRTVRDSSGREETTVIRRVGDSSHTVTTIRDKQGCEEKHETFHNMNKDKVPEFDKEWESPKNKTSPVLTDPNTALTTPAPHEGILSDGKGFFRKFFGLK